MTAIRLDPTLERELARVFVAADANIDGTVDRAELTQLVDAFFPGLTEDLKSNAAEAIIENADVDGDGKLDIREFMAFISRVVENDNLMASILRNLTTEEQDMLRDTFIHMDMDSDGFVSLEEMFQVVRSVVGDDHFPPLAEYLEPIFVVADKDRDGKLNLTEFLASFAEGPGAVPMSIINACVSSIKLRLSDEEIFALQQRFIKIDLNGDGFIDPQELQVAMKATLESKSPDMSDEKLEEIVSIVMASADADRDGKLSLSEFIRSFQEDQGVLPMAFLDSRAPHASRKLSDEEVIILKEAINDLHDQEFVDYWNMYGVLNDALRSRVGDENHARELCELIMETTERNADGKLTLDYFVDNFIKPGDASCDRAAKSRDRLQDMLESKHLDEFLAAFGAVDANKDGYIDRAELTSVIKSTLLNIAPDTPDETIAGVTEAIFDAADIDADGRISVSEAVLYFVEGSESNGRDEGAPQTENIQNGGDHTTKTEVVAVQPLHAVVLHQTSEVAVQTPERSRPQQADDERSPIVNDVSGCPISERQLRQAFNKYDTSGDGTLDRAEFRKVYLQMEHFGVMPTLSDVDRIFSRFGSGSRLTFEEFSVIMLQRSRM